MLTRYDLAFKDDDRFDGIRPQPLGNYVMHAEHERVVCELGNLCRATVEANDGLLALLRDVQWSAKDLVCPCCMRHQREGHSKKCALAMAVYGEEAPDAD